jgi:hypothetical protein
MAAGVLLAAKRKSRWPRHTSGLRLDESQGSAAGNSTAGLSSSRAVHGDGLRMPSSLEDGNGGEPFDNP